MTAATAPTGTVDATLAGARTHRDRLTGRGTPGPEQLDQAAQALDRAGRTAPPQADATLATRLDIRQLAVLTAGSLMVIAMLTVVAHPAVPLPATIRWAVGTAGVGLLASAMVAGLSTVTVRHHRHAAHVRQWRQDRLQVARLITDGMQPQTAVELLLRAEREGLDPAAVVDAHLTGATSGHADPGTPGG